MSYEINNARVYESYPNNVIHVELEYPKTNVINTVQVGVTAVRAVDGVRVTFDFDRNGWVITQPRVWYTKPEDGSNVMEMHEEWIEAAFCPAWQFEFTKSEGGKYALNEEED